MKNNNNYANFMLPLYPLAQLSLAGRDTKTSTDIVTATFIVPCFMRGENSEK